MPHVESGTAKIYYELHGDDGPAIVFAHGAGGNTAIWWQQVPHFARSHRVVTFDHRRFGRSTCPSDDFHPRHFPGDLLAILDACGIDRAALVCQSMGGWTGVRTALEHPERVACLALCGTPGGIVTPQVLEGAAKVAATAREEGVRGNAALAPDYPAREPAMAFLYDQIRIAQRGLRSAATPAASAGRRRPHRSRTPVRLEDADPDDRRDRGPAVLPGDPAQRARPTFRGPTSSSSPAPATRPTSSSPRPSTDW